MSLTASDLHEIRSILKEELDLQLGPIRGEIEALRNDIKEIYNMIAELRNKVTPNKSFEKLTVEQKLLKLNAELLAAAKQAGITLPR